MAAVVVALALAGCASQAPRGRAPATTPGPGTLDYGLTHFPVTLDGALVADLDALRVSAQIFEGLVRLAPGTTRVVPALATSWRPLGGGRVWRFRLRRGVRFHDGTPFDAAAVCFNFDRWYRLPARLQAFNATYYWQTVFGGFSHNASRAFGPSLFRGCRTHGPQTVDLLLSRRSGTILPALALPSFSIGSPRALRRYRANAGFVDGSGNFHADGSYGTLHPAGTGPFRLEKWAAGDEVVLDRNDDYWGPRPSLREIVFRPVLSTDALASLRRGEIDVYGFLPPGQLSRASADRRLRVVPRPPLGVGYLGLNATRPPFDRRLVREAVAFAVDRAAVVRAFPATSVEAASELTPPTLAGYAPGARRDPYDPVRAKRLLRRAGLTLPVRIELWYPTHVSRPYLPEPPRHAAVILASGLERAGFRVKLHGESWLPDFIGDVDSGRAPAFLLGWTADYADAYDVLGTLFVQSRRRFGFSDPRVEHLLARAR